MANIKEKTSAKQIIESYFEKRNELSAQKTDPELKKVIRDTIEQLDQGKVRVAEKKDGKWMVNEWLKKAILLSFRIEDYTLMKSGYTNFCDKVSMKYEEQDVDYFRDSATRVVPPTTVRKGAYIANGVILMPSFVNIGAYVDSGTMIDTWATVGSCAQIGKNVHISGGAGIGGVLEPPQATPTIIEDNCFIGARSEVAEGVIVEEGSVISMGVYLGQSTRILNRETGEITYGRVPAGSVVVAGNIPAKDGSHSLYCAVIVKRVDEKTRSKVSINELLRDSVC